MIESGQTGSRHAGQDPSLAGLDTLDIAALIYRIDAGVPLLIASNDSAMSQLNLGKRFPMADPWQWLDAQLQPASGVDHPALQTGPAAEDRQWRCYHIRQHRQPLRALQLKVTPLDGGHASEKRVLVAISDITDVDSVSTQLPQSFSQLRRLIGTLPMGACIIDVEGYLRLANPAFCAFFGYTESELLNAHFRKILPSAQYEEATLRHQASFSRGNAQRRAVDVKLRDGKLRTVIVEDMICHKDDGQPLRVVFLVDITERRNFERRLEEKNRRLEYLATRDELTGLHNRRFGLELLEQSVERSQRYGERVSVAMLDIDHFKTINDTYGHAVGDTVLQEFSQHLDQALRTSDTLIRWGGEEFLLILPGIDRFAAQRTIDRLLHALRQQRLSTASLSVSFSAGVGEHRQESTDQLLEAVDSALYQAKSAGRNCVAIAPLYAGAREDESRPCSST
ncbi:GGDEF domain-containing protein [Salinicola rhizosphaerae]|uniref:diguanylate cyclase n=1 Tax=Salinicola rhizosphaerae TaxID=1443141 RepID=A0ABQ3E050_9GAMM|nr:sensor domain-containing diguanylate cyclase [Salinicola rhizosphaerae]GHB21942.1 hypothetical protein GCM10009038_21060 [Salinicola rhizosphaerae]